MDNKAAKKIEQAKIDLIMTNPFYAIMTLKLEFVEKSSEWFAQLGYPETMATDGRQIVYSAKFIKEICPDNNIQVLKGVIVHEVDHIMFLHHLRLKGKNPKVWNIACDYIVNHHVLQAGFQLPKDLYISDEVTDSSYAEEIYNKLIQEDQQGDGDGSSKGSSMSEDQQGDGDGSSKGSSMSEDQQGDGDGSSKGSSVGEVMQPTNADGSSMSEDQIKQFANEIKEQIQSAYNVARKQGSLPYGIERLVKKISSNQVNWKEAIAEFATILTKNNYNWMRPNRRYMPQFILPSLYDEESGNIVWAIDTSGSVTAEELGEIAGEADSILNTMNVTLQIIYCDSYCHGDVVEITRDDGEVKLEMRGGGGTDYRPVFKKVEEKSLDPIGLIYFTDGYCDSFPSEEPDYPVLWIITAKRDLNFSPPFGTVIYFSSNRA
jgi:predicted metal-dependent peptidase